MKTKRNKKIKNNGLEARRTATSKPRVRTRGSSDLGRDPTIGEILTKAAIAKVDKNANADWMKQALSAVHDVARKSIEFTTDQIWDLLGSSHTHDNRAMGAIMRQASKLRYCEPSNTTRKTTRASNHRRPLTVWKSLICEARA